MSKTKLIKTVVKPRSLPKAKVKKMTYVEYLKHHGLLIDPDVHGLCPPYDDAQTTELRRRIREQGYDENMPVWGYEGGLIDGYNRTAAAHAEGHLVTVLDVTDRYKTRADMLFDMRHHALARRNMSKYQRCVLVYGMKDDLAAKAAANRKGAGRRIKRPVDTTRIMANLAAVGYGTFRRFIQVIESEHYTEEIKKALEEGELTIAGAAKIIDDDAKPDTEDKAGAGAKPEPKAKADTEDKAEAKAKPKSKTKGKAEPEAKDKPEAKAKSDTKDKPEAKTKSKSKPATKTPKAKAEDKRKNKESNIIDSIEKFFEEIYADMDDDDNVLMGLNRIRTLYKLIEQLILC